MNNPKRIVYMLSGLGLDPTIFQRLAIQADEIHHLDWIEPLKNEPIEAYAARLATSIQPTDGKIILIGHSFGGVMMQEISKIIHADLIILLSSVKSKSEKPASMNFWMRAFPVHLLASQKMILNTFKSWGKHHGYDTPEAQAIFRAAASKHSSFYFRWATNQLCKWKAEGITTPIVHLHGTKDRTFPHRRIKEPVTLVESGDHLMVFNRALEVSILINNTLSRIF